MCRVGCSVVFYVLGWRFCEYGILGWMSRGFDFGKPDLNHCWVDSDLFKVKMFHLILSLDLWDFLVSGLCFTDGHRIEV